MFILATLASLWYFFRRKKFGEMHWHWFFYLSKEAVYVRKASCKTARAHSIQVSNIVVSLNINYI